MKNSNSNSNREYRVCSNCVMDTTDSKIVFDEKGLCDFCVTYYKDILPNWSVDLESEKKLFEIVDKIKLEGKNKPYDCIIGLSGGLDSSYLAYIAVEKLGLRPLLYTVDTGWNLNVAVENIEKIVKKLNVDLYTEVVNWEEMKDLQLALFKANVPYQDLLQDHAIFAGLYNYAVKNGIKYVLTGANNATECVRPPVEWVYTNDITFIKSVHKKHGKIKIKDFPFCGMLKYRIYYAYIKGMKRVAPLDFIPYDKVLAETTLYEKFGWEKYANKHYENIFTRFYEGYYLPTKFGFDKRKCYYSNQILTKSMTRDEALLELEKPPYSEYQMKLDMEYIAKKLGISIEEFENLINNGIKKSYKNYKNMNWLLQFLTDFARFIGVEKRNYR